MYTKGKKCSEPTIQLYLLTVISIVFHCVISALIASPYFLTSFVCVCVFALTEQLNQFKFTIVIPLIETEWLWRLIDWILMNFFTINFNDFPFLFVCVCHNTLYIIFVTQLFIPLYYSWIFINTPLQLHNIIASLSHPFHIFKSFFFVLTQREHSVARKKYFSDGNSMTSERKLTRELPFSRVPLTGKKALIVVAFLVFFSLLRFIRTTHSMKIEGKNRIPWFTHSLFFLSFLTYFLFRVGHGLKE